MSTYDLLIRHTKEVHGESIAGYLPNDCTFSAAYRHGSNLRNLLVGLGQQLYKFESTVNLYTNEIMLNGTAYLLPEFERMLSIPDGCFKNTASQFERKRNILVKLAYMNAQTASDFEATALQLGFNSTVYSGWDAVYGNPGTFSFSEIQSEQDARFSIVIEYEASDGRDQFQDEFPLTFPIRFSSASVGVLQCALRKLAPANCQVLFIEKT